MKEQIRSKTKVLTQLIGVTGSEQEVVRHMVEALTPLADEVTVDPMGNVTAKLAGARTGPALVVSVHADEIGYVVKNILESGFLLFDKAGTQVDKIMPGRKVLIRTREGKRVFGVIGVKAGHLQTAAERAAVDPASRLFVDIGARSKEAALALGIRVGDTFVIDSAYEEMSDTDYICSKALDNRIGCAALITLFEHLQERDFGGVLYGTITTKEEYSFMGIASLQVHADYAIVVDTIPSIDTPEGVPERTYPIWLGRGPVCCLNFSSGPWIHFIHPKVRDLIEDAAAESGVAVQYLTMLDTYVTDAPEMERKGIPTGTLAIPRRYSHSPVELVHLNDTVGLVRVLLAAVRMQEDRAFGFL